MGDNVNVSGGIGISSILTIVFVILKLVGTISWGWFWVLSPTIFSTGIGLFILLMVLLIASRY